jgi:hypothetical protein
MTIPHISPLQAGILGLIIGLTGTYTLSPLLSDMEWWPGHTEHDHSTEYHIHTDFLIVVNDKIIDLSLPQYISTSEKKLSDHVHLHDNDGKVEHIHAEGVTFANFLSTLGIMLTDTCLTLADSTQTCQSDEADVALYVNNEKFTENITTYIPEDLDQILLYVGIGDEAVRETFRSQVEDRACMFSGSCPERGTPPPESCGLTCEI